MELIFLHSRTSETAVSFVGNIIIKSNSVFYKYSLTKSCTFIYRNGFIFVCVVCDFAEYMSLIIAVIIITVDNSYCIIQLQSVLESQTTSWITLQYPILFHPYSTISAGAKKSYPALPAVALPGSFKDS